MGSAPLRTRAYTFSYLFNFIDSGEQFGGNDSPREPLPLSHNPSDWMASSNWFTSLEVYVCIKSPPVIQLHSEWHWVWSQGCNYSNICVASFTIQLSWMFVSKKNHILIVWPTACLVCVCVCVIMRSRTTLLITTFPFRYYVVCIVQIQFLSKC